MDFKANIEKLCGASNWSKWKRQIELLLRHNDVHDIITGDRVSPISTDTDFAKTSKDFVKADSLAQLVLVGSMDDGNIELTATCDSAKSIWDKLLSIYEQSSGQRLDRLMEHFFKVEKEADDVVAHISKLQKNFSELNDELKRVAKTTLPDLLLMSRIMSTLPSEYFEFKSVWESIPIEDRTVNMLTERLRLIEMRLPAKSDSSALVATKKKVFKKNERKCYVCRKPGHIAKDCKKKEAVRNKVEGDAFVSTGDGTQDDSQAWIADSGASAHMTSFDKYFVDFKEFPSPRKVHVGNSEAILAYGSGTVDVEMRINGKWERNYLTDVWYVPQICRNLFSISQTLSKGFKFEAVDNSCSITRGGKVRLKGKQTANGLYALDMRVVCPAVSAEVCVATVQQSLQLWHERLCHQSKAHVKEILKKYSIQVSADDEGRCDGCCFGKQCRHSFGTRTQRPTSPGGLIHADVCGPMQETSLGGAKYFVCFKDDYTKFRRVFFMHSKNEVATCLQTFLNEAKNAGHVVKEFLSDGGTEFQNSHVKDILRREGITSRMSMPYTPEQNGAAERENRTLVESARSMIHAKSLPLKLWAEALNTTTYVLNRTGPTTVKDKSPYELWFDKRVANIDHLLVFGTPCYVHVPKQNRRKWDKKSVKGVLVGYSGEKDGFRIWVQEQNKIILSRDVLFQKELSTYVQPQQDNDSTNHACEWGLSSKTPMIADLDEQGESASETSSDSEEVTVEQGRNLRDRSRLKMPPRYDNCVLLAEHEEPETYMEAIASKESDEWVAAMEEEMDSLKANHTWKLVHLPPDRKAIGSRWVYKIKENADGTVQRFKARLVAKGYSQKFGVDFSETFSPVVRWDTIRTLISVAAYNKLKLTQFDVKTAFLYGDLEEDIYMYQPQGFEDGTGQVCKLLKSIYGLKQAPRCWNERFKSFALKCGLKQSNSDPCLFLNDEKSIYLIMYVDDGIIASVDQQAAKQFLEQLKNEFSVVIGVANYFLGMQIECLESGDIFVHQETYCKKVLKRFEMSECNSVSTPIEKGTITTDPSESLPATVPYREAIGSLMFLAIVSRPDISYAVGVLSQVLDKPQTMHWSMTKRIMRYLKGTERCGILFKCNADCTLQCFTDSDYAGDPLSRRSTSGMVFLSYGGAVSWRSQRQSCIALSTTEAEFVAASQAAKEAIWLGNLLSDLKCVSTIPVLQMDNQSAIRLVKNPEFHNRTKHIDIRYKFIREQYEEKQLDVVYCSSDMQAADIFTKPLVKDRFLKLRTLIGMHNLA